MHARIWLQKGLLIIIHVLVWVSLVSLITPPPIGAGNLQLGYFREEDLLWFFLYGAALNALMIYTYAHLALPRYLKQKSRTYFVLINVSFLVLSVLVESLIDYYYMIDVYHIKAYPKYAFEFWDWVKTNFVINGGVMVVANSYGFAFGWSKRQRELESAKLSAELLALKHQVNPHFLFNVLNSLYGLAFRNDDEPTAEGIAKLSQLMRYMLYESNSNRVPMQRELTYVEDYIALQRLRLSDQVKIHFDVAGTVAGREIAPMILIPFVENAFKHGISMVHPTVIDIGVQMQGDELRFWVRNPIHPGQRPESGQVPGGIGLQNVRQRLDILYPKAHQLQIEQGNGIYEVHLTLTL